MDNEIIKWFASIIATIVAFFTLKKIVIIEIENKLKLQIDLINAEFVLTQEKNEQIKLKIVKLEKEIKLKLGEKEHNLICVNMQLEIKTLKDCIEREFKIIHVLFNKRRKTNGNSLT